MPQFHVYTTTVGEAVATRIIDFTETTVVPGKPTQNDSCKKQHDRVGVEGRRGKYSYYMKNFVVYIVSAIMQYSVVNGTLNLLTSLAGEEKGFATLVVTYIAS